MPLPPPSNRTFRPPGPGARTGSRRRCRRRRRPPPLPSRRRAPGPAGRVRRLRSPRSPRRRAPTPARQGRQHGARLRLRLAALSAWCRRKGLDPDVPDPEMVGLYLAGAAVARPAGTASPPLPRRRHHRAAPRRPSAGHYRQRGHALDRQDRHIANVMAGIRRSHGRPPRQKEAVLGEDILAMVATLANDLRACATAPSCSSALPAACVAPRSSASTAGRVRARTAPAGSKSCPAAPS